MTSQTPDTETSLPRAFFAVQAGGHGLDDLRLAETELPRPGEGEAVVEMLRMAINPADLLMLEGRYGTQPEPPFVPGAEGVGRVVGVGPGVELAPGTVVVPLGSGNWCSHRVLKARHLVPLPAGADLDQAAMLKANPATALVMLEDLVRLEPGDWVVMNAANSAVGQNVVALGRALGLKIGCVVRREAAAGMLREMGAEAVLVDDGSGPPPGLPEGAQAKLAFDAVGGAATERLAALVADGGTVVTYGLLSGESPRLSAHDLVFRGLTLRGFWLADWFAQASPERARELFGRLAGWLAEGRIGARVAARYPLERVAEAVAHAAREGRDGKILLTANGGAG